MGAAEVQHASAMEALEAHNQAIGGLQSQLRQLTAQLSEADRVAESDRALYRAYRREAITSAAAVAFRRAATELTESLIEPVATEITWRWKRLFPNGGLTLRSDGTIVREEHGEELGWSTLSDGERIWARIITHLLVIASSTRLPFVWFDATIGSGFPEALNSAALVLGPTGAGLGQNGTLYVADTIGNRIAAIPDAVFRGFDAGPGFTVSRGHALNAPLGLVIAPNGDILTVNGGNGWLVETTPFGAQIAVRQLDSSGSPPGSGALFGLAVKPGHDAVYYVDDATNTQNLLHH